MEKLPMPQARGHALIGLENFNFLEILSILRQEAWRLAGIILLVMIGSAVYVMTITPVYKSQALVQITTNNSDKADKATNTNGFLMNGDASADTDAEIIDSRSVIATAVNRLKLGIDVQPQYFPVIGKAVAQINGASAEPMEAPLGLNQYAWGNEKIQVDQLTAPPAYQNKPLLLITGRNGRFSLLGPRQELLLRGQAGRLARARPAASGGQPVEIFISQLAAHPGTRFTVVKHSPVDIAEQIQSRLTVVERGSDKGKPTGILQLTLTGPQPGRVAETLNVIADVFIHQNIARKQEETEKILRFLDTQLPIVKAHLDAAETALANYSAGKGGVDLPLTAQNLTAQLSGIEKEIMSTQVQLIELRQNFGDRHPLVLTVQKKLNQLQAQKAALSQQASQLPGSVQTTAKLNRDVKVASDLYMLLQNKAQELNIFKAGIVSGAYLLEPAVTSKKTINTPPWVFLLFSLLAGAVLGSAALILLRLLGVGLSNPVLVEKEFDLPVYACIAHSERLRGLVIDAFRKQARRLPVLALAAPTDRAIEGLRRLRTNLQHGLKESANNIVSICSPSPGNGKTFVAVNLAYVCAFAEKKVLLIDTDMRRCGVNAYFASQGNTGLADILAGRATLASAIQAGDVPNLSFISAGRAPENPSELLMSPGFASLLRAAAGQFDMVILDTPPVLDATDALILAPLTAINLIVVHARRNKSPAVARTIKELKRSGAVELGLILNDINTRDSHLPYQY